MKAAGRSAGPSAPTRTERFYLSGPSRSFDPRQYAVRKDIADIALAGQLFAPHYARPEARTCIAPSAMLYAAPDQGGEAKSELLYAEQFALIDLSNGWAWGYCLHDHYVGYVAADALGEGQWKASIVPCVDDVASAAEAMLGMPYLAGGRGGGGIDAAGLLQIVLARCGIAAPREADQQRTAGIGRAVSAEEAPRRGDVVFLSHHPGLMIDGERLIHADQHTNAVAIELLDDAAAREPILERRRLEP